MCSLESIEIKAFVPAQNFEVSQAFYVDLGFTQHWSTADAAYFQHGHCSFMLQNFYVPAHAKNVMMHLLVKDAQAWYTHIQAAKLEEKYGVKLTAPEAQPWGLLEFCLFDPSGVVWRIGNTLP